MEEIQRLFQYGTKTLVKAKTMPKSKSRKSKSRSRFTIGSNRYKTVGKFEEEEFYRY